MNGWIVTCFNESVQEDVAGMLTRYLRLADRMEFYGPDLGMPHTRAMKGGLFELRLKSKEGIDRVFYGAAIERRIVILHSFVKKKQKTPPRELELARRRLKEIQPC